MTVSIAFCLVYLQGFLFVLSFILGLVDWIGSKPHLEVGISEVQHLIFINWLHGGLLMNKASLILRGVAASIIAKADIGQV
jgi:hypothetical protein